MSDMPRSAFNLPPGVSIADIEEHSGNGRLGELETKPLAIYESGARVRINRHVARDPAAKVTDFIGYEGIVRFMVPCEYGRPSEWCAVFWPHRAGTSIWHSDALELAIPELK